MIEYFQERWSLYLKRFRPLHLPQVRIQLQQPQREQGLIQVFLSWTIPTQFKFLIPENENFEIYEKTQLIKIQKTPTENIEKSL